MFILRDDRFITRRTIDLGMLDLIRSISERQGVDEHIALTHMLSNYEGAMTDPASMDLYHRMAAEITKAVNFYNYNNRQQALRRVYLCGGGAAVGSSALLFHASPTEEFPHGIPCRSQSGDERSASSSPPPQR